MQRYEVSFAVVPAAGRGQRMGRPKLLLPWHGQTVIESVLKAWQQSQVTRVIVVVPPHDRSLADVCRSTGVDVVVASRPPADMKASVGLALEHIAKTYDPVAQDVWLVAPADMPELSPTVIDALLAVHEADNAQIVVPTNAGRRGHPVLFPWPLGSAVFRLADDEGIDAMMRDHPIREIECGPPANVADLDTPEDYRRRHDRYNPHRGA